MWTFYNVELSFTNRVMGGVPKSKKMIEIWLDARKMKDKKFNKEEGEGVEHKSLPEIAESITGDDTVDKEESSWVGFLSNDDGLYAREHQIKGHLKDCANQVKKLKKNVVTALRDKVANKVYLVDEINYFKKGDGENFKEPDGSYEHGIRVDTPQGKRSALKKNDYIDGAGLKFGLKVFDDGVITPDILDRIFQYGSVHGIFSERAHGYGKYTFTITEVAL